MLLFCRPAGVPSRTACMPVTPRARCPGPAPEGRPPARAVVCERPHHLPAHRLSAALWRPVVAVAWKLAPQPSPRWASRAAALAPVPKAPPSRVPRSPARGRCSDSCSRALCALASPSDASASGLLLGSTPLGRCCWLSCLLFSLTGGDGAPPWGLPPRVVRARQQQRGWAGLPDARWSSLAQK